MKVFCKTIVDSLFLQYCTCTMSNLCMSITGSNQYGSILGHTSVTMGSLLDDNHWHSVVIERYRRNVNFTLDRHTQHFRTNGEFDHLDLDYEVRGQVFWVHREGSEEESRPIRLIIYLNYISIQKEEMTETNSTTWSVQAECLTSTSILVSPTF